MDEALVLEVRHAAADLLTELRQAPRREGRPQARLLVHPIIQIKQRIWYHYTGSFYFKITLFKTL